jgi:hypothetical protein
LTIVLFPTPDEPSSASFRQIPSYEIETVTQLRAHDMNRYVAGQRRRLGDARWRIHADVGLREQDDW